MLLLALPLSMEAAPGPRLVWEAEVEPIGAWFYRRTGEAVALDAARLARAVAAPDVSAWAEASPA